MLMNRDDWKHLESATKSIGSALSLKVQVLQHDEDYPQIVVAGNYYIQWSVKNKVWMVQRMIEDEIEDLDCGEKWHEVVSSLFTNLVSEICSNILDAQVMAQEMDTKLRKVD